MKQVKDRYFYKIWALYIFLFSFGIHLNAKYGAQNEAYKTIY